jgi:hypothetical protein
VVLLLGTLWVNYASEQRKVQQAQHSHGQSNIKMNVDDLEIFGCRSSFCELVVTTNNPYV